MENNSTKSCCENLKNIIPCEDHLQVCIQCSTVYVSKLEHSQKSTQLRSKYNHTVKEKTETFVCDEEINPPKYFRRSLKDEQQAPRMRSYSQRIVFEEHLPSVYMYYFKDCRFSIKQRERICTLAFSYFIQMCVNLKNLEERDLDMLVITCLLLASKLDEIDDHLPSFEYMVSHYNKSSYRIMHYGSRLTKHGHFQHSRLEECCLKTLEWNLNQTTVNDFLNSLFTQGIVLSTDKPKKQVQDYGDEDDMNANSGIITEDLIRLIKSTANYFCNLIHFILPLLNYKASLLAASCVYLARDSHVNPTWSKDLVKLTTYDKSDMEECIDLMVAHLNTVKLGGKIFDISYIIGKAPFEVNSFYSPIKPPREEASAEKQEEKKENLRDKKIASYSPKRSIPKPDIQSQKHKTEAKVKQKLTKNDSKTDILLNESPYLTNRILHTINTQSYGIPCSTKNQLAPVMAKPHQRKLYNIKPQKLFKKKQIFDKSHSNYRSQIGLNSHRREIITRPNESFLYLPSKSHLARGALPLEQRSRSRIQGGNPPCSGSFVTQRGGEFFYQPEKRIKKAMSRRNIAIVENTTVMQGLERGKQPRQAKIFSDKKEQQSDKLLANHLKKYSLAMMHEKDEDTSLNKRFDLATVEQIKEVNDSENADQSPSVQQFVRRRKFPHWNGESIDHETLPSVSKLSSHTELNSAKKPQLKPTLRFLQDGISYSYKKNKYVRNNRA
ncbi:unnamed protein product [Moneuplotes crassus]|uniref:Cyclin C-terminal domain-containing protein n=2 Tax=Euplotes crassus TaxID=5936 RepID=A0AAD1Y2T7_EUPCR|nr:unnamed protein product [Moneuplotes crassus]